jgi:hypothetical protein
LAVAAQASTHICVLRTTWRLGGAGTVPRVDEALNIGSHFDGCVFAMVTADVIPLGEWVDP